MQKLHSNTVTCRFLAFIEPSSPGVKSFNLPSNTLLVTKISPFKGTFEDDFLSQGGRYVIVPWRVKLVTTWNTLIWWQFLLIWESPGTNLERVTCSTSQGFVHSKSSQVILTTTTWLVVSMFSFLPHPKNLGKLTTYIYIYLIVKIIA